MKRIIAVFLLFISSLIVVSAQITAGRYYHIVNSANNMALTNKEKKVHDAHIYFEEEDVEKWGQVWEARQSSSGVFYLVNPYCEQAIDLNPNGDFLLQWEYSNNDQSGKNQRFYIKSIGANGLCQILNNEVPQNKNSYQYAARSRYMGYSGETPKMLTSAGNTTSWHFVEIDRDEVIDPSQNLSGNVWENEAVFGVNKEAPHATFLPYPSRESLEADAEVFSKPWLTPADNPSYFTLNGKWRFRFAPNTDERPGEDFYGDDVDASAWAEIDVPGCWEMYDYDKPLYINVNYAFHDEPPYISNKVAGVGDNPVGSYRREFTLPDGWDGQRVFLHFDGLYSGAFVWVNGRQVGYTQGGNNDAEFDITKHVRTGSNNVSVQVIRWTDGSYLEGQDMWHMSGLHRDVYLYAVPRTFVRDHVITSDFDEGGQYTSANVDVALEVDNRDEQPCSKRLKVSVLNPSGASVATLQQSVSFAAGETTKTLHLGGALTNLQPWTAETPNLYTFIVEQYADGEDAAEMAFSTKYGFRKIVINNNVVLINGKRVFFRGVNTQDTHPVLGRSIDVPTMLRDVTMMKQANVNTVRTSHYPRQAKMYAMFDYFGLYVMDEADVECHYDWNENGNYITKSASWTAQWLDRTKRMVYRDRNHPSVIFWSLGNESGNGTNLEQSYDLVRSLDPSRPVHNCTGSSASPERISDLASIMYPSISTLSSVTNYNNRPSFMCEYAHAMGNGVGNLKEYWDIIETSKYGIGGCIWDWVDQSVYAPSDVTAWRASAPAGQPAPLAIDGLHYISGYDMPGPHQGNFLNNGIITPDRAWTPKLAEVKKVYQPAAFNFSLNADGQSGTLTITNKYAFADLADLFYLRCTDVVDGVEQAPVRYPLPSIAPGRSASLSVACGGHHLNVALCLKDAATYASADYEQATEQFVVHEMPAPQHEVAASDDRLNITSDGSVYVISSPRVSLVVGKSDGFIRQYISNGVNMLASDTNQPIYSNVRWIENESPYGNHRFGDYNASIDGASVSAPALTDAGGRTATFTVAASDNQCPYDIVYTVKSTGELTLDVTYKPKASGLRRIGMDMKFPAGYEEVTYCAFGPWENYVDRHDAAYYGRYTTTVDEMYVPYVHPQSNGNHLGMRSLQLRHPVSGNVISVVSTGTEFSLSHYNPTEFLQAQVHDYQLTHHDAVYATFDYMQRGLGNESCGQNCGALNQYSCPSSGSCTQHLSFCGIRGDGETPEPEPDDSAKPEAGKVYNVALQQPYGDPAPIYINDDGQHLGGLGEPASAYGPAAMFLCCEREGELVYVNLVTGRLLASYSSSSADDGLIFTEVDDPRGVDKVPVVNFDKSLPLQRSDRYLRSLGLTCSNGQQQQITTLNSHTPYQDLRAEAFEVAMGEDVSLTLDWYNKNNPSSPWMHSYIYLDEDADGIFSYSVDNAARTVSGELRSFSCFTFGADSDTGVNSLGQRAAWGSSLNPPAFRAPLKPRDYLLRLKVDWNNLTPAGAVQGINEQSNNGIVQNGGCIIDLTLRVAPVADPAAGDVDADGFVDLDDVVELSRLLVGLPSHAVNPDVNGDGRVSIADLTALIEQLQSK